MNSDLGLAIRQRFKEARERAGLSQEQAGQCLSPPVTRQVISKWETGKSSPNPRQVAELCSGYGVSTDAVLQGIASTPNTGCAIVDKLLAPRAVVSPAADLQAANDLSARPAAGIR